MSDTSYKEGLDLGIARSVWAKVAASECRIRLLTELIGLGIGFKDVEDYSHDLGLKFKSDAFKNREGGGQETCPGYHEREAQGRDPLQQGVEPREDHLEEKNR